MLELPPRRATLSAALVVAAGLVTSGCSTLSSITGWFGGDKQETQVAALDTPIAASDAVSAQAGAAPLPAIAQGTVPGSEPGGLQAAEEATGALNDKARPEVDGKAKSYEAFQRDVDEISGMKLKTPKEVRAAFGRLLKHQPADLSKGWVAYSARLAADNGTFASAVQAEVERRGLDKVLARIDRDPMYLRKLDGAYETVDALNSMIEKDTGKLNKLGDRFISVAYDFQKTKKWGALEKRGPALAETQASDHVVPALFGKRTKVEAPTTTDRVLKLAAYLAAGKSASDASLTQDPGLEQCLRWARLNLNQCMAAAYFPSEEAYCTGKHGIDEVAACWSGMLPSGS